MFALTNKRGQSLVEIMTALAMLAFFGVMMAGVFTMISTGPARISRPDQQGVQYARETLEKLRDAVCTYYPVNSGIDATMAANIINTGTFTDALPDCDLKNNHAGTRTYTVTDVPITYKGHFDNGNFNNVQATIKLKQVSVTVTWQD